MKIGIDGRMIGEKMHGIARYTFNMLKGILKIDKYNQYVLLITDRFPYRQDMSFDNLRYIYMKSPFVSISEPIELYAILRKERFDLFHSPSFIPPFYSKQPFLMTIHDMSHLTYSGISRRLYYKFIIKPYVRKARKILTVSEFSKGEICRSFGLKDEDISVVYNGIEDRFRPFGIDEINKIKKRYNLPDRFILSIGNEKGHKNFHLLLKAFKNVVNDYSLVLNLSDESPLVRETITLGLGRRVIFLGYVDDNDLPILYNAASVFIFVSLNEGFGLPPLEAMSSGCPIIVSDTSSLPEICGDAAYYVDPYDDVSIANGINKMIEDLELRNSLIKKGLERAKLFSWERTSKKIFDLYMWIINEYLP